MISFRFFYYQIRHVHENRDPTLYISVRNVSFMKDYSPYRTCTYRKLSNLTKMMYIYRNNSNFREISKNYLNFRFCTNFCLKYSDICQNHVRNFNFPRLFSPKFLVINYAVFKKTQKTSIWVIYP